MAETDRAWAGDTGLPELSASIVSDMTTRWHLAWVDDAFVVVITVMLLGAIVENLVGKEACAICKNEPAFMYGTLLMD